MGPRSAVARNGYCVEMTASRTLGFALACDAAGIAVGSASAAGRWPRSLRWVHHAAYAGTCIATVAAGASAGQGRVVATLLPTGVALASLPHVRPGSHGHIAVAGCATFGLVATLAVSSGATGWRPSGGRSRAG